MEDENVREGAFRRRRKIPFSKEETLLILRAYELHRSSWTNVINDIKANIEQLSNAHQMLYRSATMKQLKDRVSNKFGRLLHCNLETVDDADIRTHVRRVRDLERRLVPHPPNNNNQQPADQREVLMQQVSGSESNDDDDANPPVNVEDVDEAQAPPLRHLHGVQPQPPRQAPAAQNDAEAAQPQRPVHALQNDAGGQQNRPAHRRRRNRRFLSEQVRENQALYRRFLTKKVPKILRELGVSSDTSDEDYI